MWFALRILKSYNVELEESTADHPVHAAHLGDGETKGTFPLDFFKPKNFPQSLFFFLPSLPSSLFLISLDERSSNSV